jgi:hypothetical protein
MTIIDNATEQELVRLWGIIGELSEELSRNRALSVTLYDQVGNAKVSCDPLSSEFVHADDDIRIRPPTLKADLCCVVSILTRRRVCIRLALVNPFRSDDLTFLGKEAYDGELERMNNAMSAENQGLQYDNKQLNALIKEYEQTLETLMITFRNQAVS